ncbi:hypothetical protein AYI68_g4822 [Smittium mucronatum]|uniref:RNA-binding S4 domain-containing protein n=1 Tax=Smittium mucronatum TaxID=133383 RepID=A0A1R0GW21_9FUNG|nr:hypothetical protein AYI68_g4822 [Smittium mucronatum]
MVYKKIIIEEPDSGTSLRNFALLKFRDIFTSRKDIFDAIKDGSITINEKSSPDNQSLKNGDEVICNFRKDLKIKKNLLNLGVRLIHEGPLKFYSHYSQESNIPCSHKEKNQYLVLWKPVGLSITEIQKSAQFFSSHFNPDIPSKEDNRDLQIPDLDSAKFLQDFIKNSLVDRCKNNDGGFVVVNQIEKAASGLMFTPDLCKK